VKRQSVHEPHEAVAPAPDAAAPATENASHSVLADDDTMPAGDGEQAAEWKAEYDAQVEAFKARSAEQREKAERERERWEKIRAEEGPSKPVSDAPGTLQPEGAGSAGHLVGHGTWESVQGVAATGDPDKLREVSPSPVDGRGLVTGEGQGPPPTHGARAHAASGSDASGEHSGSDIPSSLADSFPSSFDIETPPSPAPRRHHLADERGHASRAPVPVPEPYASALHAAAATDRAGPAAVTPMIFDASLAPRTRVYALLASFGINLLLPFINGVMLGVGEIFAKEIIGVWWSRPGGVAARLGLGQAKKFRRKGSE
jgi:hypothetical protein